MEENREERRVTFFERAHLSVPRLEEVRQLRALVREGEANCLINLNPAEKSN